MSEIAQHIAVSRKVDFDDLDWGLAKQHGLTAREVECLSYFADIESQTVFYFFEASRTKVGRSPEMLTFLTMWNYEEFFHSHAITRLLRESGVDVAAAGARSAEVRGTARAKATVEDWFQRGLAQLAPELFHNLWMTWGATQELLTTQAYEEIAAMTKNPVCAELCRRIAKQERRHFAYYYNSAREQLEATSPRGRQAVRWMVEKLWSPVGNGVKTPVEAAALAQRLFPNGRFEQVLHYIDKRVSALPGMEGFDACSRYGKKMNIESGATGEFVEVEHTSSSMTVAN